jgi:hypothetical protein
MKNKKQTYAQVADKLTKKIGELEKKLKSSDRFARATAQEMLPRYQEKLDALFQQQEAQKQQSLQQDMQKLQMKYGGDLTKYGIGGDIAAGLVGLTGGALGTIPVVGDMAQKGLYSLHDKLDNNLTDQEKSIRGFGAAAGGIGAAAITGNPKAAIGAIGDIQEGIQYGTTENPMAYASGGLLPKYDNGGNPPYSVDNPPTYREWLATRPDLTSGELEIYQDYISNPDMVSQFNPDNIYRGNSGIGSEYPYVEPGMASQYNQSQTQLRPGTPAPLQSDMYKDYSTNGTPTNTGAFLKEAPINNNPTINEPGQEKSLSENPSVSGNSKSSPLQDLLYKGAAYAPTIYNAIRGIQKPQELNQEEFQNPYERQAMGLMSNRRYNIDPQLQSNRSTLNNMKTNLRNYAGGNAAAYLSNMGNLQMNTDRMNEAAYAQKQNMDNQYMAQEAQFMGNMGANRAQTKFNIQDVNDRNRATRDAHMAKAVEGVSGIAQNNRRMSNLDSRDQERIVALQNMFPDYGFDVDDNGRIKGFTYKG